jgi:hypothetical protein
MKERKIVRETGSTSPCQEEYSALMANGTRLEKLQEQKVFQEHVSL